MTRSRPDHDVIIIPDTPSFYATPTKTTGAGWASTRPHPSHVGSIPAQGGTGCRRGGSGRLLRRLRRATADTGRLHPTARPGSWKGEGGAAACRHRPRVLRRVRVRNVRTTHPVQPHRDPQSPRAAPRPADDGRCCRPPCILVPARERRCMASPVRRNTRRGRFVNASAMAPMMAVDSGIHSQSLTDSSTPSCCKTMSCCSALSSPSRRFRCSAARSSSRPYTNTRSAPGRSRTPVPSPSHPL